MGAAVPMVVVEGKNMSSFCAKCGSPIAENAKFCPRCGAKVERQAQQPVKKKRRLIYAVIAAAAALLIVVAAALAYFLGTDPSVPADSGALAESTAGNDQAFTQEYLVSHYFENRIQAHLVYEFLEDGTMIEYGIAPDARIVPKNLTKSREATYEIDGDVLLIHWDSQTVTQLHYVTKLDDCNWDSGLTHRFEALSDTTYFFYECNWVDDGSPSSNAMYLIECGVKPAASDENAIYEHDSLTVTGVLSRSGDGYALDLNVPLEVPLYCPDHGYDGGTETLTTVPVQFNLTDDYIRQHYLSRQVTVSGTASFTADPAAPVCITDALIDDASVTEAPEGSSVISEQEAIALAEKYYRETYADDQPLSCTVERREKDGAEYYYVYVKVKLENHWTTWAYVYVSLDGASVFE